MGTGLGGAFVGRIAELEELREGLVEARSGRGRLFMLVGEAGIGKTRLADELAGVATVEGARVLWGRCWESGGAPAYWPWVQALRSYVGDLDTAQLSKQLGYGVGDVAQILPEVRTRLNAASPAASAEPEQARFQLFDSTTNFLRNAAQRQPIVLILEDLHAADQPSLLLLQFLARELRSLPMLIVCTARPVDRTRDAVIDEILATVTREGRRVSLPRLTREDVAQVLDQASATPAGKETVDAVYAATEGNPLFVTEVLHLLRTNGHGEAADAGAHELHLPVALRAAIRQRVAPLSETVREVLTIAAVIGREFDLGVLERVWERRTTGTPQRGALLDALENARTAGVIHQVPGTVARYIFRHALIRDTLVDDLSRLERSSLHRQVGEALEELWASNPAPYLAEIAHHFVCAAPEGQIEKAVDYTRRAGDRALALLAYEEAVEHYQRAKEVLSLRSGAPLPADEVLRCDLLLSLGDAFWGAGDLVHMRETFQLAAESARTLVDTIGRPAAAAMTARAALGFGGRQQRAHVVFEETVVRLLEDARAALGDADDPLRARVLARLAYTIYLQPDSHERRVELCRQAVAMARRCGDPVTLRWVLNDWRWALWGSDTIEERLAIADELVQLAERTGDREMALGEHAWRLVDLLELGDMSAVDAELETFIRSASELKRPWFQSYVDRFTAMVAMLEGRFSDAERFAEAALNSQKRTHHQDALLIYATQLLNIRVQQGRLDELEVGVQTYVAQYPAVTIWRYVLPYLYAELGREAQARTELERFVPEDKFELRNDYARLQAAAFLTETCVYLGDAVRAARLYEQLLRYEQHCVVVGYGIACLGSVARYLGMLAMTFGDLDAAEGHYETALRVNRRMRARPQLARTQYDYACMLLKRGDTEKAQALLDAALATARALGMAGLQQHIEALAASDERLQRRTVGEEPQRAAASAVLHARFDLKGEYWNISFAGTTFQLRAILGLTYIAQLLRHPSTDFHVTDLIDLVDGGRGSESAGTVATDATTARSLGDAGEVLDAQAKAAYRRRLADLREELEEAQELNDIGQIDRIRDEIEALGEQLAEGVGLGGRHRRVASHVERARVSVTKRVTIALKKISEHDPALAAYLRGSIKTGTLCSYVPDPGRPVAWEL